jgi:hypothetical protein
MELFRHPDTIGSNGISSDRAPIAAELSPSMQRTAGSSSKPTSMPIALNQRISFRSYLKYELGVIPKAFLNMEMKALGVL